MFSFLWAFKFIENEYGLIRCSNNNDTMTSRSLSWVLVCYKWIYEHKDSFIIFVRDSLTIQKKTKSSHSFIWKTRLFLMHALFIHITIFLITWNFRKIGVNLLTVRSLPMYCNKLQLISSTLTQNINCQHIIVYQLKYIHLLL